MTDEEKAEGMLESLSETVRHQARQLAITKAIASAENNIKPDDFDKAFGKEYAKWCDKFVGKSGIELALIGIAEVISNGGDISDILGD